MKPKWNGKVLNIHLDGMLLACFDTPLGVAPCTAQISPYEDIFVPVFSTEEKLRESMELLGHKNYVIKQIDDGDEFLSSVIQQNARVMCDPVIGENDSVKWSEPVKDVESQWQRFDEQRN